MAILQDGANALIDIDGVGQLCAPCFSRGRPPHFDYLQKVLHFSVLNQKELIESIAQYAYDVCNSYDK